LAVLETPGPDPEEKCTPEALISGPPFRQIFHGAEPLLTRQSPCAMAVAAPSAVRKKWPEAEQTERQAVPLPVAAAAKRWVNEDPIRPIPFPATRNSTGCRCG
jgi:hypothetical protein